MYLYYYVFSGSSDPNPGLEFDNAGGASSDQQMIPNISSSENNLHHSDHHIQDHDDLHGSHQFCNAYKDTALLDNTKVLKNMLDLEEFYLPDISIYEDHGCAGLVQDRNRNTQALLFLVLPNPSRRYS